MQNYRIKEPLKRDCKSNLVKLPLLKIAKGSKADIYIT
jgi:hypothetical protein